MVRHITTLIIALFTLVSLQSNATELTDVTLDFRIFGTGPDDFKGLFFFNGKTYEELSFNRTSRSTTTYHYQGKPILDLYLQNPNFTAEQLGEPQYIQAGSTNIPDNVSTSIVIIAAELQNRNVARAQRRYQAFVMNDAKETFGVNAVCILNTTRVQLYGKVGEHTLSLASGESQQFDYTRYSGTEKGIPILFAFKTKNGPRLVMSNNIRLAKNRRVILILQPPRHPNSTRIETRTLSEAIYPKKPE